jgi:peptidylprolyl isomerase
MHARELLLAALTALVLTLAACGGDDDEGEPAAGDTATEQAEAPPQQVSTNLDERPVIGRPSGSPPAELQTEDIVEGDGTRARSGDEVTMQYVGVNFSTGDEFDASWNRGEPFVFPLGGGQVIQGWDEGIVGMREGGRRMLTIPPEMGYGAQGQPPSIPPNETLVFVVDLVSVQR